MEQPTFNPVFFWYIFKFLKIVIYLKKNYVEILFQNQHICHVVVFPFSKTCHISAKNDPFRT